MHTRQITHGSIFLSERMKLMCSVPSNIIQNVLFIGPIQHSSHFINKLWLDQYGIGLFVVIDKHLCTGHALTRSILFSPWHSFYLTIYNIYLAETSIHFFKRITINFNWITIFIKAIFIRQINCGYFVICSAHQNHTNLFTYNLFITWRFLVV